MKSSVISLFAFLCVSALSAQTGYIQIKAPPGIMIFLDGNLKGKTTSEQGGLILQDVPAGSHEIKALKAGSNPKTYRIYVQAGDIAVWDAGVFAPKIMVEESGETEKGGYQPVGFLQIKSVPVEMKISIPSLGLNYSKTKPDVKFSKIPAGEYLATFSGFGKNLSSKITIQDKVTTEVFVNLLKGEVQNMEEERKRQRVERFWAFHRKREEEQRVAKAAYAKLGDSFTVPELGLQMVQVKPGRFTMGSSWRDRVLDNESLRLVTLTDGFYLGKYEVTQAQWMKVMGSDPSRFKGKDRPVERVSWKDAVEFCEKLTKSEKKAGRVPEGWAYQLPTEAQWEYACRAGTTTAYWWGDSINSSNANYDRNKDGTTPVGKYPPNPWGFYDMHGNVSELCADWYDTSPDGVINPEGPASGSERVLRGGAWYEGSLFLRSAVRGSITPTHSTENFGFRVGFLPSK